MIQAAWMLPLLRDAWPCCQQWTSCQYNAIFNMCIGKLSPKRAWAKVCESTRVKRVNGFWRHLVILFPYIFPCADSVALFLREEWIQRDDAARAMSPCSAQHNLGNADLQPCLSGVKQQCGTSLSTQTVLWFYESMILLCALLSHRGAQKGHFDSAVQILANIHMFKLSEAKGSLSESLPFYRDRNWPSKRLPL